MSKVVLDEHPAPADLGARQLSAASLVGERDGVNLQELRGVNQSKGLRCDGDGRVLAGWLTHNCPAHCV